MAYVGALCMGSHFPSVDGESGDIRLFPEVAARVLDMLPEDVRLVPGHADDCTHAQGRAFQRMLADTGAIVRREMAAGKNMVAIQSANALADFTSYESSYVKCDTMIQIWYLGLREGRPDMTGKVRPYGQIHTALKEKGVDAAVAVYQDLKTRQADQYLFETRTPMFVGRILAYKGEDAAAARFLELCIAESPASDAAPEPRRVGPALRQGWRPAAAVRHLQAYLEGYPNDAGVRKTAAGASGAAETDALRHELFSLRDFGRGDAGAQRIGLGRHDEVVQVKTAGGVGPPGDGDFAPLHEQCGVMPFDFGGLAHPPGERQGAPEVGEGENSLQPGNALPFLHPPIRHQRQVFLNLGRRQAGFATVTAHAAIFREIHHEPPPGNRLLGGMPPAERGFSPGSR